MTAGRPYQIKEVIKRSGWCPRRSWIRFLLLFCVVSLAALNQHRFIATFSYSSADNVQLLGGRFRIHTNWHPQNRRDRFPSVQERVKLYLSDWYSPACKVERTFQYRIDSSAGSWPTLNVTFDGQSKIFETVVAPDQWFLIDHHVMNDCARKQWIHLLRRRQQTGQVRNRRNMRPYCSDVIDLLDITNRLDTERSMQQITPLLGFFGDASGYNLPLPFFAKYRPAASKVHVASVTDTKCINDTRPALQTVQHRDKLKPIIWKLESSRHFGPMMKATKLDTQWEKKKNRAFWAGDMTGHMAGDTDLTKCLSNQRCRFVLEHADSNLIDCGLTRHRLNSNMVNGTNILTKPVDIKFIQSYKVIVSLEGNDVASGLKWSLVSESVVLMPPPTQTSWAMEEMLEPWIHYVPMYENGSNAEDMVQWVLSHDQKARQIAERGKLFMYDLVYHPDAADDDRKVKEEIARRYRALWH